MHFAFQMDDSGSDKTRVLPEKTRKRSSFSNNAPNPARPIRFLIDRQRAARANSNVAFVQEMDSVHESTSHASSTNYGYLEHIQSLKSTLTPEDKSLSKKVR